MTLTCGIDEAGRGPVIGPLVISGVVLDSKDEAKLKELGVKDSKMLTPMRRAELFVEIKKVAKDFRILVVSPEEIDEAVTSKTTNLNYLEADKCAKLINLLNPEVAAIDSPTINTAKFGDYIRNQLKNQDIKLIVENKADVNHVSVAAASILSKVTRDREIEKLKKKYKIEFGSGYPSDPFTKIFVEKNYTKYPIFRKSWASWKNVAKKNGQQKLFSF